MRKSLVVALVMVGCGFVVGAPTFAAVATHEIEAETVAASVEARTLTIKGADGKNKVMAVEGSALSRLRTVKAGLQVVLVCRDNDQGQHQAITQIKPVKKPKNA